MSSFSQIDNEIFKTVLSGSKASKEELEYAEAYIAELHPDIYLLVARTFIQKKIFDQRINNFNNENEVTNLWGSQSLKELSNWFLNYISYVLQRLLDDYDKDTAPLKRAIQDLESIVSLIANSGICIEDHYSSPWSLCLIAKIRLEISKSDLDPNSIFNIEDKIQATRWSLPRRCIFSLNNCRSDFRSTASIKKYLEEKVDKKSFPNDIRELLAPLADRDQGNILKVNWMPYAEQIPFSFFFCLVSHIIGAEIEFVPVAFDANEIIPLIENHTLSAAVINTNIAAVRALNVGTGDVQTNIKGADYLCSSPLLRYEGYDALVTVETLESIRTNSNGDADNTDPKILMNVLKKLNHKIKFWSPAIEFTDALRNEGVALTNSCNKKIDGLSNFLLEKNALAMGGSIQLKYLNALYPTKTVLIEKAFKSSTEAFIVSSAVIIADDPNNGFNAAVTEVWKKAIELTDDLFTYYQDANEELINEISKNFTHDISLYSEDVIIADFSQLKEAYQSHTSKIESVRNQHSC